ncbi:MAG TPA: PadR family transcriptional regulator [Vicinamibacteria bacterium]
MKPPAADSFVPLRTVEFQILLALADGERHGYAIMQEALARSGGSVLLEPGTLYRALRRMLAAGLITRRDTGSASDTGDERRRYYALTALGRRVAAAEASRMAGLVLAARSRGLLKKA